MAGDTHHQATVYRVRYGEHDHDLITSITFGSVWDPNDIANAPNDKAIASALPPYQQQKLLRLTTQTTTTSDDDVHDNHHTPSRQKLPPGFISRKRNSPDEADTSSSSNSSSEGVEYIECSPSSSSDDSPPFTKTKLAEIAPNLIGLNLARGVSKPSCAEKRKLKSPRGGLRNVKKKQVSFCDETLVKLGEQYRNEMMRVMRDMVISDDETGGVKEQNPECLENIEITDVEAVNNRLLSNSMLAVL